jgi:hypothetical protein
MGMGELKIWLDVGARLGHGKILGGAAWGVGDGVCHHFSLKIAAKYVRADMVSSPTLANGISG